MAIQHFSHVGICVSDLQASLAFYRDLLGFQEVHRLDSSGAITDRLLELEGVELTAVFLERDGVRLELLRYAAPAHTGDARPGAMNRPGLTHLSLRVDDLDATLEVMRDKGVAILDHTRGGAPEHGVGVVFVSDPDGTRVELLQQPGDPARAPGA
jgi:lactoylglutathione lyase